VCVGVGVCGVGVCECVWVCVSVCGCGWVCGGVVMLYSTVSKTEKAHCSVVEYTCVYQS